MKPAAFIVLAATLLTACGGNSTPTAPTPVTVAACQSNNTAQVIFRNDSRTTTQDIFWDGLRVSTITPGQSSTAITAAAGVPHQLSVRITNTSTAACVPSSPILPQCSTQTYFCAFP